MLDDAAFIRDIAYTDAEAIAQLSSELGYPAEADETRTRLHKLLSSADRAAFVASVQNHVVGWIEAHIAHHLASGAYGEIAGLIVRSDCRGFGIGRKLLLHAERWIADQEHDGAYVKRIVVRSRSTREAAHRFYLREGYLLTKTSAVFTKLLPE